MNNLVTAEWLKSNLGNGNLIVLDTSPKSNKAGLIAKHPDRVIRGSKYADLKTKFSKQNCDLPNSVPEYDFFQESARSIGINRDSQVVIYDNLGIYSAPRLWYLFKSMGHSNVKVLDGGLNAWIAAGGVTSETHVESSSKGDFEAIFDSTFFVDADQIFQDIETQQHQVLDARSSARFKAEVAEPREGLRGGHIPNSKNLPFKDVLEGGFYKSKESLQKIFAQLELKDQKLIYSCGSGLTACIILLAAHQISKNDFAIYDGSWTEWGQMLEYPVVNNN